MLRTPKDISDDKDNKKAEFTPNPQIMARMLKGRRCDGCHRETNSWRWDMNNGMLYCPNCDSSQT